MNTNECFSFSPKLKISIVGMVLEGFISGSLFLVLFQILKLVFDGGVSFTQILHLTIIVAVLFALRLLIYATSYTNSQIGGSEVSRNIRIAIGDKLKRMPLSLFTKNRTGFYINAATSEVGDFEQIITHKIASIIQLAGLLLMVGIYACTLHLVCGLLILFSSLLLIPSVLVCVSVVNRYGKQKNLAREKNVSAITEYLVGSQTLRSYGLVGKKNKALTNAMKNYSNISYNYEKGTLPPGFIMNFISYVVMAFTIVIASKAYLGGEISAPSLVMLIMIPSFTALVNMTEFINLVAYRNFKLSKDKLKGILNQTEELNANESFCPQNTNIEFKNVTFGYNEDEPVLKNMNFKMQSKSFNAIVGDSGSGKSTVLNLITKYYCQQNGIIKIGNCTTDNVPAAQVMEYISLVDQDVFLFNDSVLNNIRYAKPDATDDEIKKACSLANCNDFIMTMEKGYNTEIGENGNKLSGGERQRLSIARAILKDSPIILLDEATASLDIENELLVKRAIANLLKKDKTVVMIAHTLPIIQNADQILVVNAGQIEECGTHRQLLAQKGKYSAMWQASQLLR